MGNILKQGIAAYQQTMGRKPEAPEPPDSARPEVPKTRVVKGELPSGLLKTAKSPVQSPPPKQKIPQGEAVPRREESKYRRVAKLLILIGSDQAAGILAQLDPPQVEEISREIASIRGIGAEESEEILSEFRSLLSAPYGYSGSSSGGVEAARRILYTVLGPEKGEALLNRAVPDSKENIFGFLEEFSAEQLVLLLKEETPQAAALILSRLPSKISAGALSKFPAGFKTEILKRIARQSEVSPDVLERVAAAVKEKARHLGSGTKDIEIDGMQTLAAILKQGDYSFGDRLISELEERSPDIGRDLKERLYTLDDIIYAIDRPLQEKLKTMGDREIAILLKGRSAEFAGKLLCNVSASRRDMIREEGELLGAVPKRDCDAAAREFLAWFRLSREKGEIILASDEDVLGDNGFTPAYK
jgi:flagellar motor switch protein FliG